MPPISGAAEVDFGVSNPSRRDLKLLSWEPVAVYINLSLRFYEITGLMNHSGFMGKLLYH